MKTPNIYHVLCLRTGNSARSILAEAILNAHSAERFCALSASSHAVGAVNPRALELLQRNHHKTDSLRSTSWDEFALPDAPVMDFVFTACDQAAAKVCPAWPSQPISEHWGVADPAAVIGNEAKIHRVLTNTLSVLSRRISLLLCLPIDKLSRMALTHGPQKFGHEHPTAV